MNTGFGSFDERDAGFLTFGRAMKDVKMQKLGHCGTQFLWLGSSWMCNKKRRHYQSFYRNGIKISVNAFVFVLAEENKQLVAHLEDMYEDSKGSKMVVVRWFHRIDEVNIDLPHKFSDREVFFSLCLQDLKVECIDGIATVLSPLHFDKYLNGVRDSRVPPFVCQRLFDDSYVKPFDITQVKGYSAQEVLLRMYSTSVPRTSEKAYSPDCNLDVKDAGSCPLMPRPRKRLRLVRKSRVDMQHESRKAAVDNPCLNGKSSVSRDGAFVREKLPSCFGVGSEVEILSQDSGMRGCWFRASIVKKHKDNIKVRYLDVQDADDEVNCLEEWVSSCRVVVDDILGLRINGRMVVRPSSQPHNGTVSWAFEVGSLVDAWWHDGWWEGIVICIQPDDKVRVYFPGEKRDAVFRLGELRHSQEWVGNNWKDLHGRADLATKIQYDLCSQEGGGKAFDDKMEAPTGRNIMQDSLLHEVEACSSSDKETDNSEAADLSKHDFLARLQWKSSRKRSRTGHLVEKLQKSEEHKKNSDWWKKTEMHRRSKQRFLPPAPAKQLKVDHENCKYREDSLFNSSIVVPAVRSLVMSR